MDETKDDRPANAAAGMCSVCGERVDTPKRSAPGDSVVQHRTPEACVAAREARIAAVHTRARARVCEPSHENAGPGPFCVLVLDAGAWLNAGSAEEAVRAAFERGGLPQWRRSDGNWESVTVRLPVREAEPRGDFSQSTPDVVIFNPVNP